MKKYFSILAVFCTLVLSEHAKAYDQPKTYAGMAIQYRGTSDSIVTPIIIGENKADIEKVKNFIFYGDHPWNIAFTYSITKKEMGEMISIARNYPEVSYEKLKNGYYPPNMVVLLTVLKSGKAKNLSVDLTSSLLLIKNFQTICKSNPELNSSLKSFSEDIARRNEKISMK